MQNPTSSESTDSNLKNLLALFNPSTSKLGKHTVAFAAALASSAPAEVKLPFTIETLRTSVAASLDGKGLPYPNNISANSYSEKIIGGIRCYLLRNPQSASVPTLVMFYGGGFCLNTLAAHQAFMANIAAQMPCNIMLPDCPLAPETKAPEVIAKLNTFMQALLKNPAAYEASEKFILMGWSSGSNLALTLTLNLQKQAPKLFNKISQLILLSPWIDLTMQVTRYGPYQTQQNMDTIAAGADLLEIMSKWYLPEGYKGNEPQFCPAFRDTSEMKELPPVTIIAGGCEVLLGDGVFLADKLRQANVPVQFIALEGQTHNYLVFHQLSLDGVFVPTLIKNIVTHQSIDGMVGKDGLGLVVKRFNMHSTA